MSAETKLNSHERHNDETRKKEEEEEEGKKGEVSANCDCADIKE